MLQEQGVAKILGGFSLLDDFISNLSETDQFEETNATFMFLYGTEFLGTFLTIWSNSDPGSEVRALLIYCTSRLYFIHTRVPESLVDGLHILVRPLMTALNNPDKGDEFKSVLSCFWNLSNLEKCRDEIARDDGLSKFISLINSLSPKTHYEELTCSLSVVSNMSAAERFRVVLAKSRAVDWLIPITFSPKKSFYFKACIIIGNIAASADRETREIAVKSEGIHRLLDYAVSHSPLTDGSSGEWLPVDVFAFCEMVNRGHENHIVQLQSFGVFCLAHVALRNKNLISSNKTALDALKLSAASRSPSVYPYAISTLSTISPKLPIEVFAYQPHNDAPRSARPSRPASASLQPVGESVSQLSALQASVSSLSEIDALRAEVERLRGVLGNIRQLSDSASQTPSSISVSRGVGVGLGVSVSGGVGESVREGDTQCDVFISYRRANGSQLASLLKVYLSLSGYSVFLDVDRLGQGKFDEALLSYVETAPNFLLLLTENALDRCVGDTENKDWVHNEIATAIKHKKKIIPVIDNFKWPVLETLPEDMREVYRHNGVEWVHGYQSACVEKLISFLRK
eukprot:TRINITY_DN3996_c1_g1_i2.p1 TRINITY_DN3996_c1_g1~~TRINITY_DN3996_c1_g1_i2.p1  ORF type:complete len:607 (-),score=134.27 TRINITY_DN3996_c1_g1_i2:35-1747(-)